MNKTIGWAFLSFLMATPPAYSQSTIHFYSYDNTLFEKYSVKMAMKGGEDPWVQDVVEKYLKNLISKKIVNERFDSIPLSQVAKDLLPKPKDKLWVFVGDTNGSETTLLGVSHAVTYQVGDGISFDADPKPLMEKCHKNPGFLNYANRDEESQWADFELYEVVFVSVPAGTPQALSPKPTTISEKLYRPLLDKINNRLEATGVKEKNVSMEMTFQALGEKYLVVNIHQEFDFAREIYQVTKKGFRLVYRNALNTAESD